MERMSLRLNTLEAVATGEGRDEAYLWTFFFVIDGIGFTVDLLSLSDARLSGSIRFRAGLGSQGNLGTNLRQGDVVPIPPAVGAFDRDAAPIDAITTQLPPVIVAVVIAMEEDNVTADGAEAGHQALNAALEREINGFLRGLNLIEIRDRADTNGTSILTEISAEFDAFKSSLQSSLGGIVRNAIQDQQSFFENIWAWVNPDDQIGDPAVQFFSADQLSAAPTPFEMRMTGEESDYIIRGDARSRELVDMNPDLSGDIRISCASTFDIPDIGPVIRLVGGTHEGREWIMSRAFAAQMVIMGRIRFFVDEAGQRTDVHVVHPADGGEPFLRTDPDRTTENNLLSLPPCSIFAGA